MKYILLLISVFSCVIATQGQTEYSLEIVVTTASDQKTHVKANGNGGLEVHVSSNDDLKFKAAGWVRYSDFGTKGDGRTDDMDAIAATHAYANQQGLLVKADEGSTCYIGGKERTTIIMTDTDFGTAAFIIDDTEAENRTASVFRVSSSLQPLNLEGLTSLKRNQEKINVPLRDPV